MVLSIRASYIRRFYATSSIACIDAGHYPVLQTTKDLLTHSIPQVDLFEVNSKLKDLVKTGHLNDARYVFDRLPHRDEISWTTMISGYTNASNPLEALSLFSRMWVDDTLLIDPFILSIALKACGLTSDAKPGELLHGYCVKACFVDSVFVGSALLDMYMKTGKVSDGCRVFDEMPIRNVVSWTAIITGLVRAGYNREGLLYFSEMWREGVAYDSYTFAIALKACADAGILNYGREIHTHAVKTGFDTTSYVANTLGNMYNKCGKVEYGLHLFEKMTIQDVVSWTMMITAYVQMGQEKHAIQAFLRMRESEVRPNEYTFAAIISGCANLAKILWGEQLHAHVLHVGLSEYLSVGNSIMVMYSKCGKLDSASMMFHGMIRRDIVTWSTIIAAYAQAGLGEEAFEYLSWMRREGPKPTEFAFASVLSVSGNVAILEQGKQLHAHVLRIGLDQTPMIQSSLINLYSKCGSIGEASKIFNTTENDDIVSWTAMINGYAEHGYSKEAISLFQKLSAVGLRPDPVTLIGVLTAFSHVGQVDLGFHYFNSMAKEYRINPSKQHYGIMIDLLCRAGRLADAEHMINNMPFEKDDVVWSTLLRASRLHGDVERGRHAAEQILKIDPNCAGAHITLANIYSSRGRWREAADIRRLMRSRGVMKEPGWSWIKVKERVSVFVAGDRKHPQSEDMYCILELIASREDISVEELLPLLYDIED